jgi:hypothetical protein
MDTEAPMLCLGPSYLPGYIFSILSIFFLGRSELLDIDKTSIWILVCSSAFPYTRFGKDTDFHVCIRKPNWMFIFLSLLSHDCVLIKVETQDTNSDGVAVSICHLVPVLLEEFLFFLIVLQNLSKGKTVDHGILKANSTCIKD